MGKAKGNKEKKMRLSICGGLTFLSLGLYGCGLIQFGSGKSGSSGQASNAVKTDHAIAEVPDAEAIDSLQAQESASNDNAEQGGNPSLEGADPEVLAIQKDTDVGVKSGSQIYYTLLAVTGIKETAAILKTYKDQEAALPQFSHKLADLGSGNITAIFRLSAEICSELVKDQKSREAFFTSCNLSKPSNQLSNADKACIASNLVEKFWSGTINPGMSADEQISNVVAIIDSILPVYKTQDANTTLNVSKAACAHVATSLQTLTL